MPAKNVKSDPDKLLCEEVLDVFQWTYKEAIPYLNIMDSLQRQYDAEINPARWPTISKVPIAVLFNMVQKALPNAIDQMFPLNISLTPTDNQELKIEQIENSEWYLNRTLNHDMQAMRSGFTTLVDMFKFGCGLGIVESYMVTPPASSIKMVVAGKKTQQTRAIEIGKPIPAVRYKYGGPGRIFATPDGTDFNGTDRCSVGFYVDFYSEAKLREMYKTQPKDGSLEGNVEQIIKDASDLDFNCRIPVGNIIAKLAGYSDTRNKASRKMPAKVPVLKAYYENKHLWIANGKTIMFRSENKYQTMRCPVVKACPWMDGQRLYPSTPATVSRHLMTAYTYFIGCLLDLLSESTQPTKLYDRQKFPEGFPRRGPQGEIPVAGMTDNSITYLERNPVTADVIQVGDILKRLFGESVNQPEFLNQATAGLMRGGGFAFGDLTRSLEVRDALVSTMLNSTWITDLVTQTLIILQSEILQKPQKIARRGMKAGKKTLDWVTVTPEDFTHAFEFQIDTTENYLKSAEGRNQTNLFFGQMKDDPYVDRFEVRMQYAESIYGEERARKILPMEKAEAQELQQREQEMLMAERAKRMAAGQGQGGGMSPEQGRLMGAGATALAGGGA